MPTNIYESVKKALQDIIAPQMGIIEGKIESLRGETKGGFAELRSEIKRLDEKIDGVEKRIDSLRNEFSVRFASLEREVSMAIDLHERIAAIETKLALH